MPDYQIFDLRDVILQSATTIRSANLAYKSVGTLNASKDNVIAYPISYSGEHDDNNR